MPAASPAQLGISDGESGEAIKRCQTGLGVGSQEVATQVRQQPVPGEAWASDAVPPVTGTVALGSLPPWSTGVLSVKQKMVLPTPRGVVRLGERCVRTIRAGTEGMHNKR